MKLTANSRQVADVTILDIHGRIVLGEESAFLRDLVAEMLSKGNRKLLFNLQDVEYIDTSGLGFLISALTKIRREQGELKLLKLSNRLQEVMQITKLYTVFEVFEDEAAAVRSFSRSAAASV